MSIEIQGMEKLSKTEKVLLQILLFPVTLVFFVIASIFFICIIPIFIIALIKKKLSKKNN